MAGGARFGGSVTIRDPDTDLEAKVEPKSTGENGVHVIAETSYPALGAGVSVFCKTLLYQDMNVANGGIARSTAVGSTFEDLYSYTGSGVITGFLVNVQTLQDWTFQLEVDGEDIFDTAGLSMDDFLDTALYGFSDLDPHVSGLRRSGNIFQFIGMDGNFIKYETSVTIKAKNPGGKKFLAGLISLTKET